MEERLNNFRETITRQKEKRQAMGKGFVWNGGHAARGSLSSYAADVLAKKNASIKSKRFSGVGAQADIKRKEVEKIFQEKLVKMETEQTIQQALPTSKAIANFNNSQDSNQHGDGKPQGKEQKPIRLWQLPIDGKPKHGNKIAPDTPQSSTSATSTIPKDLLTIKVYRSSLRPHRTKEVEEPQQIQNASLRRVSFAVQSDDDDESTHGDNPIAALPVSQATNIMFQKPPQAPLKRVQKQETEPTIQVLESVYEESRPLFESNRSADERVGKADVESLLDGQYDEDESRNSFLEALKQWRNVPEVEHESDPVSVTNEGTSTLHNQGLTEEEKKAQIATKLDSLFSNSKSGQPQSGLTYMDRLMLGEMRDRAKNDYSGLEHSEIRASIDPGREDESELQQVNEPEETTDDTEIEALLNAIKMKASQKQSITPLIVVKDVTHTEDEEILKALDSGIMVECIPKSKLKVVEPDEN